MSGTLSSAGVLFLKAEGFSTTVGAKYFVDDIQISQLVNERPPFSPFSRPPFSDKFPEGYIVNLDKSEWDSLKSKISTSIKGGKVKLPSAFTEKGLYMLATILKGDKAVRTTITIIETFAKIRNLTRNLKELSAVKDKDEQKSLMRESGVLVGEILDEGLETIGSETSVEVNFAVLKLKHTVKKGKK